MQSRVQDERETHLAETESMSGGFEVEYGVMMPDPQRILRYALGATELGRVDTTERVDETKSSGDTEHAGQTESSKETERHDETESSGDTEHLETETSGDTEHLDDTEPPTETEPSQDTEHVDQTNPSQETNEANDAKPSKVTDHVDETARSDKSDRTSTSAGLPGLVFIISAMEKLQATREGKRREMRAELERVLGVLRGLGAGGRLQRSDVDALIGVLSLVETGGASASVVALDSIEKLVSFRYFDDVDGGDAAFRDDVGARLVRVVAGAGAGGDAVQVQVVKALFALVSWGHVRQAALLMAMRTVVSVFVAGGTGTQTIAQGTVAQMVNVVMARAGDDDGALDAFLAIRALCRLAMRNDGDGRARCLALNLLRQALGEHTAAFTTAYVCLRAEAADGSGAAGGSGADGSAPQGGNPAGADEFGDTSAPDAADAAEQVGAQLADRNTEVAVPLIAAVRQYVSLALSRSLAAADSMAQALGLGLFELALRHVRTYMRREMEVLLGEIVLPVVESRGAGSLAARARMLQTLARVAAQPQLVVELYLNYDCAEDAGVSVFQRLAEALCRLAGAHVGLPPKGSASYAVAADNDDTASAAAWRAVQQRMTAFNAPSTDADAGAHTAPTPALLTFGGERDNTSNGHGVYDEYAVRQLALDALAALLQSMVVWSDRLADPGAEPTARDSGTEAASEPSSGADPDDPHELLTIKTRKAQLAAGSRQFAWKPRKGIEAWRAAGLLTSNDPREIARFLYAHRGALDKVQLGEYLGDGDAHNVAVMHAFVDCVDFARTAFVPALRRLLQAFRLPGEAQKIDRFMLKFAERFVMSNPGAGFANADAAYVLAYSVVLLNTDQHSPQVKHRMTRAEFISNNRGINDGSDLDPQMLSDVFDQVVNEEIKLKDDPLQGRMQGAQGSGSLFVLWGNSTANRIREQHAHASAEMAAKSEQSIRSMARPQRRRRKQGDGDAWEVLVDTADYLRATRADHVAPMFGAVWTAVLAALSSPMQTSSDPHVVAACLVGFQSGIALACRFRMPLERTTFVTTLRNFTQLQNLAEMRRKHVEAIRALVEVAAGRADVGDGLDANWLDVLQCVSQLEQLQLLTQGSEQARRTNSARASSSVDAPSLFSSVLSVSGPSVEHSIPARAFVAPSSEPQPPAAASKRKSSAALVSTVSITELAKLETNSQVLVVTVDRLFTASVRLSGAGIVDFVRALSQVAWAEIATAFAGTATSAPNQPKQRQSQEVAPPSRLFSMTKIVEIAYYNMERIRVEWSQIWAILGPLFDRVGAYSDTRAAMFALDSLRQLSMKFLEKEELPHFAFQKEFLRPFADILEGDAAARPAAADLMVKDMVLRCVYQLVQAAATHIRSGWKAVLNVAQIAARDPHDQIAEMGFHIARECAQHHGPQMWALSAVPVTVDGESVNVVAVTGLEYFHELIDCLSEFAVGTAAAKRPRFALGAIDTVCVAGAALGAQVMQHSAFAEDAPVALDDQPLYRVWTPVLRALFAVVMHTDDLEVRTRALDAFYRVVMTHGAHFSPPLWAHVLRTLVFPMFADLRDPSASRRFATVDDLELWFSTTLIKALRHVIALYSAYYPRQLSLSIMTEVLELLVLCIAQPSEVLGKVGTLCLHDMIRANYQKWDARAWTLVCDTLARLFNWSQPRELFSVAGAAAIDESNEQSAKSMPVIVPQVRRGVDPTHASNRPSPLRTGGSGVDMLPSTGEETPSPGTANGDMDSEVGNGVTNGNVASSDAIATPTLLLLPRANAAPDAKPDYVFITLKCILQLLLIQTMGELFGVDVETGSALADSAANDLYSHMSAHHLFVLLDCLDQSRAFAHRFNANHGVRRKLVEMGVMPTMPSLLKQETGSVLMELHILQHMHADAVGISLAKGAKLANIAAERQTVVEEVDDRLSQLVQHVVLQYLGRDSVDAKRRVVSMANRMDPSTTEAKKRMVMTAAWRPSVLAVLSYILRTARSTNEKAPFRVVVSRLWHDLVEIVGVAVDAGDRDVVGVVQQIMNAVEI
ncbi:guanine nucleotide exchange protein for ADP-robosylation factor [Coemansia sp. RSA 638]|nr:guanine nucleotide exchange protein for ADP-robosylation factor [Coemansia sp. RSA 638]